MTLINAIEIASRAEEKAAIAIKRANEAVNGWLDAQEKIGAIAREIADLSKLVRESMRRSHHDLEEVRDEMEDSKVHDLRRQLKEARTKYDSLRARDKAFVGWMWKVAAMVFAGVAVAWTVYRFGWK